MVQDASLSIKYHSVAFLRKERELVFIEGFLYARIILKALLL